MGVAAAASAEGVWAGVEVQLSAMWDQRGLGATADWAQVELLLRSLFQAKAAEVTQLASGSIDTPDDDLYERLGLPHDAPPGEVRSAYRRLARKHHPDKGGDPSGSEFKRLSAAYDVLRNEDSRRIYDSMHNHDVSPLLEQQLLAALVHVAENACGRICEELVDHELKRLDATRDSAVLSKAQWLEVLSRFPQALCEYVKQKTDTAIGGQSKDSTLSEDILHFFQVTDGRFAFLCCFIAFLDDLPDLV